VAASAEDQDHAQTPPAAKGSSFTVERSDVHEPLSGLDCGLFCTEASGDDDITGEGIHHSDFKVFGLGQLKYVGGQAQAVIREGGH
jgi:hypothetical protein